ncbi:hypothetical protein ACOTH1_21925 [Achromobacter ruhlandii]|uniref:hypothetical protein n=1 Tax=Achromobacter ruhlandii TaxID=72557 RepID=UPI003B9C65ED
MIIKELGREEPVQVYGVYWINSERFYWVIPYEGYGGLMALGDKDVKIVDSSLSSDLILCKDGDGPDMILHWAAEGLIDDLAERDPIAMAEFLRRLKS